MFYYLRNKSDKKIVLKSLNVEIEPHGVVRVKKVHFVKNYTKYKKDPFAIKVMLVGAPVYKEWIKKNNKKGSEDESKANVIKDENISGNGSGNGETNSTENDNENKNGVIDNENEPQNANEENETGDKNPNNEVVTDKSETVDNQEETEEAKEENSEEIEEKIEEKNEDKTSEKTEEAKDTEVKKTAANKKNGTSRKNTSKANGKTSARPSKK